jgi:pyruvate/2-oxoglutarate dehydrogenase complex dihydrolipoamide acyltransferase (E2) component
MAKVKYTGTADVYVLPSGEELAHGVWSEEDYDPEAIEPHAPGDFEYDDGTEPGAVDATDAAKAKAEELGVDLQAVEGTGKDGRITVDDVEKAQPAEAVEGPPIGGDLSNEARTAGEQPHALLADEEDPYVESDERNPGAHPHTAGVGSESPTGDNSRGIDESDPDREPVEK